MMCMDSVKCEVVIGDMSPPTAYEYKSNPMRTQEQVEHALSVLLAGEGIFWRKPEYLVIKKTYTIWFWDGLVGWHLRSDNPQGFTADDWSQFSVNGMDKNYKRIPSPFLKK